ncbi:MAG: enoyl-CoA hydratase/isomerase family protein [Hyphomicrobiaceae bacterium]
MSDVVKVTRNGDIAVLTLNREGNLNAISMDLARGVVANLVALDADESVKGIVLTGDGKRAFCAGVDLVEARGMQVADIESWFGTVCAIYKQIVMTKKPIIAALNGIAAGGGFQIALVSDMRVAHPGVRMGQPEINAGIPSIMGSYWMSFHIGWSKNQELSMTGRLMDAEEARQLGIVNVLVNPDDVVPRACAIAADLASKPSVAWARTKARFRELALAGFEEAFRAGVLGQQEAYARGEPQAVMDAFFAKRAGGKRD